VAIPGTIADDGTVVVDTSGTSDEIAEQLTNADLG